MARLSIPIRKRIVALSHMNFQLRSIHQRLQEEGVVVSKKSIRKLIRKFKNTQSVRDLPRKSRDKFLTMEHYEFIDKAMEGNDELTVRKLHEILVEKYTNLARISKSSVKKARKDLGWVSTRPRYCQLIRDVNKEKRFAFCEELINSNDDFHNVIWNRRMLSSIGTS